MRNIGQASVPAGVVVGFYEGDPAQGGVLLGKGTTTKVLYPAEAEDVVLELPVLPPALMDGSKALVLVVDDSGEPHAWTECRVDNNKTSLDPACKLVG